MKAKMIPMLLGLVSLAAGESLIASRVNAGEVCNYRNQVLALAQAYRNQEQVWVSEGWWLLNPGDCISYPDGAVTYLQFQEDFRPSRTYQKDDQEVLEARLCVVQDRFTAFSADTGRACTEAGGTLKPFLGFGSQREIIQ
jgi:uncharacterized membrane protein